MNLKKTYITLGAIGLSAALLWGCDNQSEQMSGEGIREETGEAVNETQEAGREALERAGEATEGAVEETGEAVEETGDRIESTTD